MAHFIKLNNSFRHKKLFTNLLYIIKNNVLSIIDCSLLDWVSFTLFQLVVLICLLFSYLRRSNGSELQLQPTKSTTFGSKTKKPEAPTFPAKSNHYGMCVQPQVVSFIKPTNS